MRDRIRWEDLRNIYEKEEKGREWRFEIGRVGCEYVKE